MPRISLYLKDVLERANAGAQTRARGALMNEPSHAKQQAGL